MNATSAPIGFPFLALPDEHGQLGWPGLEKSVRDGIRIVLSTRPGERLMRPEFGGGLESLLHEPNTLATRRRIRDRVQGSLVRWEPRILLDAVEVWDVPDAPSHLRVEIQYRLPAGGLDAHHPAQPRRPPLRRPG